MLSACALSTTKPIGDDLEEVVVTGSRIRPNVPIWNLWIEASSSSEVLFAPAATIAPGAGLNLVIDLASITYQGDIMSAVASESLIKWLGSQPGTRATLKVLLIPDARYFLPLPDSERLKSLDVNLSKLKSIMTQPAGESDAIQSPLRYLKTHAGRAAFSFGRQVFHLRTKSLANLEDTEAHIAVSFWIDDSHGAEFPIDELSVPVCIGRHSSGCENAGGVAYSLMGPTDLNVATQAKNAGHAPDAALQFIALDETTEIGIFRCNTCTDGTGGKFATWQLAHSESWLIHYLTQTVIPGFQNAAQTRSMQDFERSGEALYNMLFSDAGSGVTSIAFSAFAMPRLRATPQSAADAPILFVRMVAKSSTDFVTLPVRMMALPLGDGHFSFVGEHFRVETPLEFQDYTPATTCIGKWTLLVPPNDIAARNPQLGHARDQLEGWISVFGKDSMNSTLYEDIDEFYHWIDPDDTSAPPVSLALVILSHQGDDQLFFESNLQTPAVYSQGFTRAYGKPSVALLDVCGGAEPGAADVVNQLNAKGMAAILASATAVEDRLGGIYLAKFLDTLNTHRADLHYDIGMAAFDASLATSRVSVGDVNDPDLTYGSMSLVFSVLGNDQLRLCTPQTPSATMSAP